MCSICSGNRSRIVVREIRIKLKNKEKKNRNHAKSFQKHNITYVLNLSLNCPKSDILQSDEHFMRIPVNDNYQEKLLPYFAQAYNFLGNKKTTNQTTNNLLFLEKVRERNAVVLIHCLAGISRSPTVAISYIMKHKRMGSDEAYK